MLEQGYGIMPNNVLYSKEITDKQKLLFCVISSLCAEKGYCRATNECLGELLGADKRTISRNISQLIEKGFICIGEDEKGRRTIAIDKNVEGGRQKCLGGVDKNVHPYIYTNITNEYTAEKKSDIPTPSELVEAYKQNSQLVAKVKDESVIWLWANYKQKRKSKAYKTVEGFIQQLIEDITTVSYGEIRYDVGDRLRYAYNKAINGDNVGIWRDDKMERGLNNQKRLNSLTPKQNE